MSRGIEQQYMIAGIEPQLPHPDATDVLSEIERLRAAGERETADIVEFVNHHKEYLGHVQFGYLGRDGNDVIYLDKGQVVSAPLETKYDARALLDRVKQRDETEGPTIDSYRLRSEILAGARGDDDIIKSHEAYTFGTAPLHSKAQLEAFLDDSDNWLPERVKLHEEIATEYVEHSAALHSRVAEARGDDHPHTLYYLRGNTAAGKSTALRTHTDRYGLLLDSEGKLTGAFNTDAYKHRIKQVEAAIHGRIVVANQQVHIEGSRIKRLVYHLLHEQHGKGFEYLLVVADGLHGETRHYTQEQIRDMSKSELGRLGIGALELSAREQRLLELHMEQVGARVINGKYINDVASAMGKWFTSGLHTVLQANTGKSLREAIDDRSKLLHDATA